MLDSPVGNAHANSISAWSAERQSSITSSLFISVADNTSFFIVGRLHSLHGGKRVLYKPNRFDCLMELCRCHIL